MIRETPDAPPPAETAVAPAPAVAGSAARPPSAWLLVLAVALSAVSLMVAGLLWQRLDFTRKELARRSQEGQVQAAETRALASQADARVQEMQARLALAESRLSEVSLQRSQLEELMLTLSRSRDDTLVQDIESALRLAQQQAQLTGSVQPLLSALQAADGRIARAAQPRLNPLQRALGRDVARLRAAAVADVPSLVQRIDELARGVDLWPLANEFGAVVRPASRAPTPSATGGASSLAGAAGEPASAWMAFWLRTWNDITRSGRELLRVSRIDRPEAALLAPEHAFFLRENLKLKLLNARLGLLARQSDAVHNDLKSVDASIARYFDTSTPDVRAAQLSVTRMRAELAAVAQGLPQPEESLAALAVAAGGR
jgi:uroporphyrin-III C-methyltransferase